MKRFDLTFSDLAGCGLGRIIFAQAKWSSGGVTHHAPMCCNADFECIDGYCTGGRCVSGERGMCSRPEDCGDDYCLMTVGRCVECIYNDDCGAVELYCSPSHVCTPAGAGCTPAGCAATGKICGLEGECRDCVSNEERVEK